MSIDTSVPCGTRQIFVLSIRDVLMSPTVTELFGQTKVDNVNEVTFLTEAHEKIIGLDIYKQQ